MPIVVTFPNGNKAVLPATAYPALDDLIHDRYGQPSRRHDYRDASGGLLFVNCRYSLPGGDKTFSPLAQYERPDGSRAWLRVAPLKGVLYGWDRLAANPDKPVLIVEGEKCVDLSKDVITDYIVICWYGGAGKAAEVDLAPLTGRDRIVLFPDNDEAGRTAMDILAQRMLDERIGTTVEMVNLEKAIELLGVGDGGDIADIIESGIPAEDVTAFLADPNNRTTPRAGSLGRTPQAMANRVFCDFLTRYGIFTDAAGHLHQREDVEPARRLTADDVVIDRICNRATVEANAGGANVRDKFVSNGARVILADMARERRRAIIENLSTGGDHASAKERLSALVTIWTGQAMLLVVSVLHQFMWNVRRAMAGLAFEHDVMPILIGDQGNGKSTAVKKLMEPLEEVVEELNVETLSDSRRARELAKYYVGVWDEMSGARKGDIESIKNAITCKHRGYRPMKTNDDESVRRIMSYLGTSNNSLAEMILDPTGARRFFEILCSRKMDFAAINSFDYLGLWRSIDPHAEAPIIPVLTQVREQQEDRRFKDSFDLFVEDATENAGNPTDYVLAMLVLKQDGISSTDLINAYHAFCKSHQLTAVPLNAFFKRCKDTLFDLRQSACHNRQRRYYFKEFFAQLINERRAKMSQNKPVTGVTG